MRRTTTSTIGSSCGLVASRCGGRVLMWTPTRVTTANTSKSGGGPSALPRHQYNYHHCATVVAVDSSLLHRQPHHQQQYHQLFHAAAIRSAPLIMKVPTMGDSITEGTIVEWAVQVGQAVQDGDVVAMVETDKVTVEIKATTNGVVTKQFGKVDDTVEVGKDLYEIDADAQASVVTAAAAPTTAAASGAVAAAESTPVVKEPIPPLLSTSDVSAAAAPHRTPSIHFLGKDGWEMVKSGHAHPGDVSPAAPAPVTSPTPLSPHKSTLVLTDQVIKPTFGRLLFSESEMEALVLGGANLAPQVLAASGGAKFK